MFIKPEATVAACKCKESKKTYGVRFEKMASGNWKYTWAFPMKASAAAREGYDQTVIVGDIEPTEEYPGCPYCGVKYFVICECGKLNCNIGTANGTFKCEWCGLTGEIIDYAGSGFSGGGDR